MNSENTDWLMTVPAGDCNFKSALERATEEEIRAVIFALSGKNGTKTKITALERELRKRKKKKPKDIPDAAADEYI